VDALPPSAEAPHAPLRQEPPAGGSQTRRVAWNTGVQAVARLLAVALGLLTTVVLTRYLGVEGYGAYVAVTVYVTAFAVVVDWGTATVLVRELAARGREAHPLVGAALALRVLIALGVALLAAALLPLLYGGADAERVRLGALVALPFLLFSAVATTISAFFQSQLRMGRVAAAELAGQAAATGTIVTLAALGRGFYEIVAAFSLSAAVFAAVTLVLARGRVPLAPRVDLAAWRSLGAASLPLGAALVVNAVYFRADPILLSVLRGERDVGIYGVAYRFLEVAVPFSHFLVLALFPLLAAAAADRAWPALHRGLQRGLDVLAVAGVALVAGILATAPALVPLLVGAGYEESVLPLRLMIPGAGLLFLTWLLSYVLVAVGRQGDVLRLNLAALALAVGLNLLVIPAYGPPGASAVKTACEALLFLGALWLVRRRTAFRPSAAVAARAVAAGAAMLGAMLALDAGLAVDVAAGAAVYAAALALLRVPGRLGLGELLRRPS